MSDFSRYMIVTDLDGTFLSRASQTVERNLAALERFRAGGGLFTIASGRVHLNIRTALDPEQLLTVPAVLCNGGYLYDFKTCTPINEQVMPREDVEDIVRFLKSRYPDIVFRVSTRDSLRIEAARGLLLHDIPKYDAGAVKIAPLDTWPLDDWYKITFREEREVLNDLRAAFVSHFGDRFAVMDSGARVFEAQMPGCSKAAGLEQLRRLAGIDRELCVIACGDFENDMPMLRAADYAVAPANAHPDVKATVDFVMCDCDEGLIADVVEAIEAGRFF